MLRKTISAHPINARKDGMVRLAVKPGLPRCVTICCVVLSSLALYLVVVEFPKSLRLNNPYAGEGSKAAADDEDLHKLFQGPAGESRCLEPDSSLVGLEDEDMQLVGAVAAEDSRKCECPDPLVPAPRDDTHWFEHHEIMSKEIEQQSSHSSSSSLDVLLIGDSITERWRGTRMFGQYILPEETNALETFQSFFNQTAGGKINGCAVGASGDITTETLWHLQNGFLPSDGHPPKVFFLLIGTNDLGRMDCSKKTTLVGILNIAEYLHKVHPNVPILVHGLLPRNDYGQPAQSLGLLWQKIMWINREIRKYIKFQENWFYMDAAAIFLHKATNGDIEIREDLMPDGLHPNVDGYRLWGPSIVQKIMKILEKQ